MQRRGAVLELTFLPRICVAKGERYFTVAGINSGNLCAAVFVEPALDDGAVGEGDAVALVRDGVAVLVDKLDCDPMSLTRRNSLIGRGIRGGAARLYGGAGGSGAHVLIGVAGRVIERAVVTATHYDRLHFAAGEVPKSVGGVGGSGFETALNKMPLVCAADGPLISRLLSCRFE